MAALNKGNQEE